MPEQPSYLFEALAGSELLHRVSAIEQRVGLRVHFGDGGCVNNNTGKAFEDLGLFSHCVFLTD